LFYTIISRPNRFVEPGNWSTTAGKVKGNSTAARQHNAYFDELRSSAYEIQRIILSEGWTLNISLFKERRLGKDEKPLCSSLSSRNIMNR
jgi:hypothetical protein